MKATTINALNTRYWQTRLGKEFRKALRRAGADHAGHPSKRSNLAKAIGISSEALAKFSYGCGSISRESLMQLCALLGDREFAAACSDFVCSACGGIVGQCACEG